MALPKIETLEKMALQVDEEVRCHSVRTAISFVWKVVFPARRHNSGLLPLAKSDGKIFALFVSVCEKMNLVSPVIVAYLVDSRKWKDEDESGKFAASLRMTDLKTATLFLHYAVEEKNWRLAMLILRSKPKKTFMSVLVRLVYGFHSVPESFPATKILLKRAVKCKPLLVIFERFFIEVGNADLFEFVVENDLIPLTEVLKDETEKDDENENKVLLNTALSVIVKAFDKLPRRKKELKEILMIAMETGLSTFHADYTVEFTPEGMESPMYNAVVNGRLDIVKLLYRTGATTNKELHKLLKSLDDGMCDGMGADEDEREERAIIYRYVKSAAQQPRRLQDLGLLQVSHLLGCRSLGERADIANKIRLPTHVDQRQTGDIRKSFSLRDRVLFKDVLLDFKDGTPHQARNRDPIGFSPYESESDSLDNESISSLDD